MRRSGPAVSYGANRWAGPESVVSAYRVAALVLAPVLLLCGTWTALSWGGSLLFLFLPLTVGVAILQARLFMAARAEEEAGDESAGELVRETLATEEFRVGPGRTSAPETTCRACGGAVPIGAPRCDHCGADLGLAIPSAP